MVPGQQIIYVGRITLKKKGKRNLFSCYIIQISAWFKYNSFQSQLWRHCACDICFK